MAYKYDMKQKPSHKGGKQIPARHITLDILVTAAPFLLITFDKTTVLHWGLFANIEI